jgi:DNA-binding transcriptional MerR regulator
MFTIGEFSKVTGLSVKTLRFYHEEGLLVPTSVDDATGYRYYDGSPTEGKDR